MPCAREVFDLILDKLKSGKSDAVEREVIRSADRVDRNGRRVEVLERCEPFLEDRPQGFIALEIDAADLARPVVEIVVSREFFVSRFGVFDLRRRGPAQ